MGYETTIEYSWYPASKIHYKVEMIQYFNMTARSGLQFLIENHTAMSGQGNTEQPWKLTLYQTN